MFKGIPDGPLSCVAENITAYTAQLSCVSGYDGGTVIWFDVLKNSQWDLMTEAKVDTTWLNNEVLLLVHELYPSTNYTMFVYQHNSYGRSVDYVSVDLFTECKYKISQSIFI